MSILDIVSSHLKDDTIWNQNIRMCLWLKSWILLKLFFPLIVSDVSLSERVQALRYLQLTRQLLSCSADGGIAVWNMDAQREEVCIIFMIACPTDVDTLH